MGDVTEEQPAEDDQPIIPMLDLSDDAEPTEAAPVADEQGEPSRLRMVGGILLLFGALGLVVALILPLYRVGLTGSARTPTGSNVIGAFTVTAWGTLGEGPGTDPLSGVIAVIVGITPMWGIPLVFVALLLVAAGSAALWRPNARYVPPGAIAATALLVGCFAMLAEFMIQAVDPTRLNGPVTASVGAGFWLMLLAVAFAILGMVAVLCGRSTPPARVAETGRDEPETPPMGFPAPVVLPRLDDHQ